jgi:predicted alpha-1,2-mannosidase
MKTYYYLLLIITLVQFGCKVDKVRDDKSKADYINPIIGAATYGASTTNIHGYGKTFPGAATPFGLVQLSPDTRTGGDNGCGYSWTHTTIEGFSFTHMSGVGWNGDLGNFLVMPTIGKLYTNKGLDSVPEYGYRSRFSHDNETAEAGYYSVLLTDYDIRAELSAAPRAGIIRFTFPENDSSRIQIDLSRRVGGTSTIQYIKVENDTTISGWMKCPPEGGGWGNGDGHADYTVYFYCQFSKPLKDFGVWSVDVPEGMVRKNKEVQSEAFQNLVAKAAIHKKITEFKGEHLGFFTNFKTKKDEQVLVKSGISFVNVEGAKLNLTTDIPDWNFDGIVKSAKELWNKALSAVTVEGATERDKEIFYTALYHTMIDPRICSDADGNYIGADKKVHKITNFTYRTIFSGWDVFRSQFPLQTIINPTVVNDEINSLIQLAELSGRKYYERWELLNAYTGCMIGNPALSVIADAYAKGIRNYDIEKAYTFCKNTVDSFGNGELGYVPYNTGGSSNIFEDPSISETMEYSYFDWCMGRFAELLNKPEVAKEYYAKSLNYKKLWNDEVWWFRSRDDKGGWAKWEGKATMGAFGGQGCVESNPYQQGWFVPHDIPGLTELMGGKDSIQKELIRFFEQTPDDFRFNDYYNHANEPVHHVPFMFNEIGLPGETQKWTRKICNNAYGTDAFGLVGNEDCGQLSAWYVLAAMGIHPICPGDNKYQITSPVFDKIVLQLDKDYYNGNKFTIIAHNNSPENIYIKSIKLNGKTLDRWWISHSEIVNGGLLEMEMGK